MLEDPLVFTQPPSGVPLGGKTSLTPHKKVLPAIFSSTVSLPFFGYFPSQNTNKNHTFCLLLFQQCLDYNPTSMLIIKRYGDLYFMKTIAFVPGEKSSVPNNRIPNLLIFIP
jgi:hypothetical protein